MNNKENLKKFVKFAKSKNISIPFDLIEEFCERKDKKKISIFDYNESDKACCFLKSENDILLCSSTLNLHFQNNLYLCEKHIKKSEKNYFLKKNDNYFTSNFFFGNRKFDLNEYKII